MTAPVRIGILADSHGRVETTALAVRALLDAGAELLLHLGDLETEEVLDEMVGHETRIVFGNCDWQADALTRYARNVGITVDGDAGRIEVASKRIVFTHGHLTRIMDSALAEGVEYLLHGHTHEVRDDRIGATRVINPGALFRAVRYTAAVLEPATDDLEFIEIPRTPSPPASPASESHD